MTGITEKLNLVRYNVDAEAHIQVKKSICQKCVHRACTSVCPAQCYEWLDGELYFTHDGCLECGACKLICDAGAIDWDYPRGGFGVCFRFG